VNMSQRGIYYISTGDLLHETIDSIRRVNDVSDYPVAVATDQPSAFRGIADDILRIDRPARSFADKAENMDRTPFEQTIYLDTDTWVVDPEALDELFELLDRVDLGAALDTARRSPYLPGGLDQELVEAPPAFSMLNTGVLVFDRGALQPTFEYWKTRNTELRDEQGEINDQIPFREAVYQSGVDYGILPTEYNFRVPYSQFYSSPVRILHGRCSDPEAVANELNQHVDRDSWRVGRMYHPIWNTCGPLDRDPVDVEIREMNRDRRIRILRHLLETLPLHRIIWYTLLGRGAPRRGHSHQKEITNKISRFRESIWDNGAIETGKSTIQWLNGGEFAPGED
jgi:hypothetical protein